MAKKITVSLQYRLAAMVGIFALLTGVIVVSTYWVVQDQQDSGAEINVSGRQRMLSQKFTKEFLLAMSERREVDGVMQPLTNSPMLASLEKTRKLFTTSLSALRYGGDTFSDLNMTKRIVLPPNDDPEIEAKLSQVASHWTSLQAIVDRTLSNELRRDSGQFVQRMNEVNKRSLAVLSNMNAAVQMFQDNYDARTSLLLTIQYLALIIGAAVFIGVMWYIINNITKPIVNIADGIRKISITKDFTHSIPVKGNDEISAMAREFNALISELRKTLSEVIDASTGVSKSAQSVAKRATANRSRAEQQHVRSEEAQAEIQKMGIGVGQVAASTSEQNAAAFKANQTASELLASMMKVVESLDEQNREVATTMDRVRAMGETGGKVVQTADAQASMVGRANLAMEKLTKSVDEMTKAVDQATEEGQRVLASATEGRQTVTATVEGMKAISDSSQQISEIIGVITEIAEQTNLLALNAAIEAARAGAHGKGFAVVADEVGQLAQRSSEAAKEITQLIKDSTTRVTDGAKLSDASIASLGRIDEGGRRNMEAIEAIANTGIQLVSTSHEVQDLMNRLSSLSEQIAAMAGEQGTRRQVAEQSLNELIAQAQNIGELVNETRLGAKEISDDMAGIMDNTTKIGDLTAAQAENAKDLTRNAIATGKMSEETVEGAGGVVHITEALQEVSQELIQHVAKFKV